MRIDAVEERNDLHEENGIPQFGNGWKNLEVQKQKW